MEVESVSSVEDKSQKERQDFQVARTDEVQSNQHILGTVCEKSRPIALLSDRSSEKERIEITRRTRMHAADTQKKTPEVE